MARLLVLAFAFGLTVCQQPSIETEYKEGRQYVYKYESEALSGLPVGTQSYAGLRLTADVVLEIESLLKTKMQLHNPHLYKINDRLDGEDVSTDMLPIEHFDELINEDVAQMKVHLMKPTSFSYVRGHVDKLSTEDTDPDWSVDIKRAVLSLLEMNFNERQSLDPRVPLDSADKSPVTYRVIEPSVSGECETLYRVQRSDDEQPFMTVHKVPNFDKCMAKVMSQQQILNVQSPKQAPSESVPEGQEILDAQSSASFTLLGSPDRFIIVSARAQSQYNVVPYTEQKGRMITITKQRLDLVGKKQISNPVRDPESPKIHRRALMASHNVKKNLSQGEREDVMTKIRNLMDSFAPAKAAKMIDQVPELLVQLADLSRKLDKESLLTLAQEQIANKKPTAAGQKLLDILPSVGTHAAVNALMALIQKKQISAGKATTAIMTLSLLPKPDAEIVNAVKDFIKFGQPKDAMVQRAAWLCLGTLGNKLAFDVQKMNSDIDNRMKVTDSLLDQANDRRVRSKLSEQRKQLISEKDELQRGMDNVRSAITEMVTGLRRSDDAGSQLLAVKVSGLLGYRELGPALEEIVKGPLSDKQIKMEAVSSLAYIHPSQKACSILLPVFLHATEAEEVRMLALKSCVAAGASKAQLEMVAASIHSEPSINVAAFVSSLLTYGQIGQESIAAQDCVKQLRNNVTLARRLAKEVPSSLGVSNYMAASTQNADLGMRHSYEHVMLYAPRTVLPAVMSVKYAADLLGKRTDVVEIGYKAEGMDAAAAAFLGDETSSSIKQILDKLLHPRQRRDARDLEQKIKEVKHVLGVQPLPKEKTRGHLYVKVLGHELIYVDLEQFLPSSQSRNIVVELLESLDNLLNIDHSAVLPVQHIQLQTAAGMPLSIRLSAVTDLSLHTTLHPDFSQAPQLNTIVDIEPRNVLEVRGEMMVDLPCVKAGVSVKARAHVHVPVSMALMVDQPKSKAIIKILDETELHIVGIHLSPCTVVRIIPSSSFGLSAIVDERDISDVKGMDQKMISYEVGEEMLGRRFSLTGQMPIQSDPHAPAMPLSGKMNARLTYKPISSQKLQIQIQLVKGDVKESSKQSSSFWSWLPWGQQERAQDIQDSVNLEEEDLSIQFLERKFVNSTAILETGTKTGLVIRVAESGSDPKYELQMSALTQTDRRTNRQVYAIEVKHTAKLPGKKPWKMVNTIDVSLPDEVVEPSDLDDPQYINKLKQELVARVSVLKDSPRHISELVSALLAQVSQEVQTQHPKQTLTNSIEDAVSHVVDQCRDTPSQALADQAQDQRKIEKMVNEVKNQMVWLNGDAVEDVLQKIQTILAKSDQVVQMSKENLGDQVQNPERAALALYIILKQDRSTKAVDNILDKLMLIAPAQKPLKLKAMLKDFITKLTDLKKLETEILINRQQAKIEVDEDERKLADVLKDLESGIYAASDFITKRPIEEIKAELGGKIASLIEKSKVSKVEIDQILQKKGKVDKILQAKLLEVLLQKKVFVNQLKEIISSIAKGVNEKKAGSKVAPAVFDKETKAIEKILMLTEILEIEASGLIKRLMVAILAFKEKAQVSSEVRGHLNRIQIIEAKQVEDSERLHVQRLKKDVIQAGVQISDISGHESPAQILKDIVDRSRQNIRDIIQVIRVVEKDVSSKEESLPVFIKSMKVLLRQSVVIDKIKEQAKLLSLEELAKPGDRSAGQGVSQVEVEADKQKEEVVKVVRELQQMLILGKLTGEVADFTQSDPASISSSRSFNIELVQDLMRKAKQVRADQSAVDEKVKRLSVLQRPHPNVRTSSSQQAEKIRAVIDEAKAVQSSLEDIHRQISAQQSELGFDRQWMELASQVAAAFASQGATLQALEGKLQVASISDTSVLEHLQDVQKIKDSNQRHEQAFHSISAKMQHNAAHQANRKAQVSQVTEVDSVELQKALNAERPKGAAIIITTTFGHLREQMEVMKIKVQSQKSLEQLLDEMGHVQGVVMKSLRAYKQDRHQLNDPQAARYQTLTQELNTNRHIHLILSAKAGIPRPVKAIVDAVRTLIGPQRSDRAAVDASAHAAVDASDRAAMDISDRAAGGASDRVVFDPSYHAAVDALDAASAGTSGAAKLSKQVEIIVKVLQSENLVDAELRTPSEVVGPIKVRAPILARALTLDQRVSLSKHLSQALTGQSEAVCSVAKGRAKTLDDQVIGSIDAFEGCEKVLLVDRSPRQRLLVTSHPGPMAATRVVMVLTRHHKIEIIPDMIRPRVKVDEQEIQISRPVAVGTEESATVIVKPERSDRVQVQLPQLGVTVICDGKTVSVKVPHSLQNDLAGLCGHADPAVSHLARISERQAYAAAYLLPSANCDAKSIQNAHGVSAVLQKSKQRQPITITKTIRQHVDGKDVMCMSVEPVTKCPEPSKAQSWVEKMVGYHCVPADSLQAQQYQESSKRMVVRDLQSKRIDLHQKEQVPTKCYQ